MYNAKSMKFQEKKPKEEFAHYHFHYHFNRAPQTHRVDKIDFVRRIRSDGKGVESLINLEKTDVESISSRRSWKNAINPQIQARLMRTVRSSKMYSGVSNFKKMGYSSTMQFSQHDKQGQALQSLADPSKEFELKQRCNSTILPNNINEQSFPKLEHSFGKTTDLPFANTFINPQESRCRFKKKQITILNANEMNRLERSPIIKKKVLTDQKYNLLEEQCKYLRQKFMEHYSTIHPEVINK